MRPERVVAELRRELADAGLDGSFLVRDLRTGQEIAIEPDVEWPMASLVKVPLAVATLERVRRGELDGATRVEVRPVPDAPPGPPGLFWFRHPVEVAVDDLLYLSMAISDSRAADALFALTPPPLVNALLRELGVRGLAVRHDLDPLTDTPVERFEPAEVHLAHSLAVGAGTPGRGHPVAQLDVTRANAGSARAFADLLQALWRPSGIPEEVAARVRELMSLNVLRQRLAPDFTSDATRWSSKTGTLLTLRHEVGVVEHDDGQAFAVAALTGSTVPAAAQPGAEAVMGRAARRLRDCLRLR